jgi:3-phenylpropionate/trans-cinnamate dioxygenase ferredoxin reductase subunit
MTVNPVRRIVIVGSSLGGASAAVALREQGFDGDITLVGDELHLPYERPPLSKAVLTGEHDEPDWVADSSYYGEHGIDLRRGVHVTAVRTSDRVVVAGSDDLPYDRLLLATGAEPRTLDVPGADLGGLYLLRTLDDALALRATFVPGKRVVVVGAGWIGSEVASAAHGHGCDVVVLDPLSQPLLRVVGEEVGAAFAALHRDNGVDLRTSTGLTGFLGSDGRVTGVQLSDATSVPADVVVVGVGVRPRVELAEAAGLTLALGGVAVDASLRTSDPSIYAVGDIAAHDHPRYGRLRVEHWDVAKEQGTHVSANLAGADVAYDKTPFFFSDQYDLGCEYRGHADPESDELVVRGSLDAREFTAFWLRDGAVRAAMNVNMWDDGDALGVLVDTGATVTASQLREADLAELAAASTARSSAGSPPG